MFHGKHQQNQLGFPASYVSLPGRFASCERLVKPEELHDETEDDKDVAITA